MKIRSDPDANDLEAIRSRLYENIDESERWSDDILALIAAVEALRERGAELVGALDGTVIAWEALPGPRYHTPSEVEQWLSKNMKPAMDVARAVLAAWPAEGLFPARQRKRR